MDKVIEEEVLSLLDELRQELAEERAEILGLMGIIHHYEAVLLSFSLQTKLEYFDKGSVVRAMEFAEKVSNKSLSGLYKDQESISELKISILDFKDLPNNKPTDEEIH
tara:strand:+ start:1021 stop:1344 length:324 start_codon:yes stop_codon:yes gene_type:complete